MDSATPVNVSSNKSEIVLQMAVEPTTEKLTLNNENITESMVRCITSDGKTMMIKQSLMMQAYTFRNMVADLKLNEGDFNTNENSLEFFVQISESLMKKIVEWMELHKDGNHNLVVEKDPLTAESKWFVFTDVEKAFFDVSLDVLAKYVMAANFFELRSMYLYSCQMIARHIKDCPSVEELRQILGEENDMTKKDIETLDCENVLCRY